MLLVRSTVPPEQTIASMRPAIAELDPQVTLYGAGTLDQMLGLVFLPNCAAAIALGVFGALALVLAATGIQGLVAYAVARREREIGIRIAVGASRLQVLRLVLTRIIVLLTIGAALGFLLALAAGQLLASIVYQMSPRDPITLAGVAGTMIAVGVVSCAPPARRALRVDPVLALRSE